MSMDTRNLYDRWTKDVHAGGAYHATIYIPGYVWPTEPCFLALGSRKMASSACLKRHPPAGKQVIFFRPARRDLWCRLHLSDNDTGKNPYKSYGCAPFAHVRKSTQKPYFAGEKFLLLFHIFGGFSHELFAVEKIT